jgi:hypothetical protein
MKLTTKKLKELIKEELGEIEEKVDYSPQGGGGALLPSDRRDTICRQISQGITPAGMSDDELKAAKQRCEDQRMYSDRAVAYRKGQEDEKSFARARADKEARLSSEYNKEIANNFVKEMNGRKESFVDRFFSDSYVFSKKIFNADDIKEIDKIRRKNPNIFGAGQYNNPIKMDVIDDAGGFGSFLEKTGAFAYADKDKVYLDPEEYLKAAKMARGISSTESGGSTPKKKGFFGKLKSFVGLEESNFSITSEQLRQIVNEELKAVIKEKQKK